MQEILGSESESREQKVLPAGFVENKRAEGCTLTSLASNQRGSGQGPRLQEGEQRQSGGTWLSQEELLPWRSFWVDSLGET